MEPSFYVVLITNEVDADTRNELIERFQSLLKVPAETAQQLAANPYTIIKRQVSESKAQQMAQIVESTGCRCEVIEEGKPFVPPSEDKSDDDENDTTVLF